MTDLREGVAADLEPVQVLDSAVFGATAWTRIAWAAEFDGLGENRVVVVAVSGEVLAGYAVLRVLGPVAELLRIGVAAGRQRAGVGTALLGALIDKAEDAGCAEMLLEVGSRNAPALSLYRGHGFEELSRRRRYYPGGTDAIVMRRGLPRRAGE